MYLSKNQNAPCLNASRPARFHWLMTSTLTFFLTLFILVSTSRSLQAQDPPVHWTSLNGFSLGYQLSTSAQVLGANQQFSIKFHLDVPIASSCHGARIDMKYSSRVASVNGDSCLLAANSWLGETDDVEAQFVGGFQEGEWTIERPDQAECFGSGPWVTVYFVVGDDSINASEVVEELGGGLIVVDNMDLRLMGSSLSPQPPSIKLYPNPFHGELYITWEGSSQSRLTLKNLQGVVVKQIEIGSSQKVPLDMLPSGIYIAELNENDGTPILTQRVVKR